MILDYLAHDWLVQLGFIAALTAVYISTMVKRGWEKEAEAERQDKRFATAQAAMLQVGKKSANNVVDY